MACCISMFMFFFKIKYDVSIYIFALNNTRQAYGLVIWIMLTWAGFLLLTFINKLNIVYLQLRVPFDIEVLHLRRRFMQIFFGKQDNEAEFRY